ncbi:hypothetical protein ON058_04350 [Demequina sp. B12]|uniref:anti-sigma factor family protein n=1 Tax=Demequina sp. B12 TaxID=2992757 RepID=UPI00237A0B6C|nr:hypothetical protein [Demequina sp. B12]MDE0572643.1 hypothetical protein [Demequina sp. B12]
MTEPHLGQTLHDLLDNRLSAQQAADAMAHIGACGECRTKWDELRAAREALKTSSAGIDMRFAQQLLDRERMAQIAQFESKSQVRAASGQAHRPVMALMLALILISSGVVACYAAGAPHVVGVAIADGAGQAASGEGSATASADADVAYISSSAMRDGEALANWSAPDWDVADLVPVEARVLQDAQGRAMLVAWVVSGAHTVTVTEQRGELDLDVAQYFPTVDFANGPAYWVNDDPMQVVWDAGDFVMSATCHCTLSTLEATAASFPSADGPGLLDRLGDGAVRIANVVTGD